MVYVVSAGVSLGAAEGTEEGATDCSTLGVVEGAGFPPPHAARPNKRLQHIKIVNSFFIHFSLSKNSIFHLLRTIFSLFGVSLLYKGILHRYYYIRYPYNLSSLISKNNGKKNKEQKRPRRLARAFRFMRELFYFNPIAWNFPNRDTFPQISCGGF
jgi:hypothetical protein